MSSRAGVHQWLGNTRAAVVFVSIIALLSFAACSGEDGPEESGREPGAHPFAASFNINIDADRSVKVDLKGSYTATATPLEAEAGKTDVYTKIEGVATFTNLSADREIGLDDADFVIELLTPSRVCTKVDLYKKNPDLLVGPFCSQELTRLTPSRLRKMTLAPSEALSQDFTDISTGSEEDGHVVDRWGTVKVADGESVTASVNQSVMAISRRLPILDDEKTLLPTCETQDGRWVDFWSESDQVNTCSTYPKK